MWIQNQSLVDKAMCVGSVYVCCEYAWGGGITIFYAPINSTPTPWEVVYHVLSCSVVSDSLRPMDCSLPDSSVHGILQLKILEWVAIRFSRGSSLPRNPTQVSCIASEFFTIWVTPGSPGALHTLLKPVLKNNNKKWKWKWSHSVASDSLRPHGR